MKVLNKSLKRRIIEISYKNQLSHIGSCITAVDIIDEIYAKKKPTEKFILSSGHAGLALYCVLEKYSADSSGLVRQLDAEEIFKHHGVHPDLCNRCNIDCSSGSLGHGLPIAVGIALADRSKNCYTLLSDGEMQEGSCYEALQIAHEQRLENLKVYINCNGWGAYKALGRDHIVDRCRAFTNVNITFRQTSFQPFPFLQGQNAHYITLSERDYLLCQEILTDDLQEEKKQSNTS